MNMASESRVEGLLDPSIIGQTTKEAPGLSKNSAKMLLIQRAGLPPASTPHSAPSGGASVTENPQTSSKTYC